MLRCVSRQSQHLCLFTWVSSCNYLRVLQRCNTVPATLALHQEGSEIIWRVHRVCWAFVWRMPWWDALQLVRWRARDEPGLAARVLSLLDAALHREPYTPRPAYGQLLTGFKLQLLAGCPDPSARAVSMVSSLTSQLQSGWRASL